MGRSNVSPNLQKCHAAVLLHVVSSCCWSCACMLLLVVPGLVLLHVVPGVVLLQIHMLQALYYSSCLPLHEITACQLFFLEGLQCAQIEWVHTNQ